MRVLFTNNSLSNRAGTELYTLEVARELKARGHEPMAFTLDAGALAGELRLAGIPVVEDLKLLPSVPELIHGHHAIETTLAAMTFRQVPVLSFCHGPEAWQEAPCRLPNVAGWIAVDDACRHRLVEEEGIAEDRVTVILNFVDLDRFPARGPLPPAPRRALVFSNSLSADHPVTKAIEEACGQRGIVVEKRGIHFGDRCDAPEAILPGYDLVFAKARCALEAMACGCALMQADYFGAGRLVRSENFNELRRLNFGFKSMTLEATAAHLGTEIDRYDAMDAAAVSARVRSEASLAAAVDQLLDSYRVAMGFCPPEFDPAVAAADFLRFQLYLSKLPVQALHKTPGIPLRLPVPPLARSLQEHWHDLRAGHEEHPALRIAKLETKLANQVAKSGELKAKILALKEKVDAGKKDHRRGWRSWLRFS